MGKRQRVRPLGQIVRLPRIRIALGALMACQLVMIGTTSTAAVYLLDHGHDVAMIGLAVSLHLGGMYVASPITGWHFALVSGSALLTDALDPAARTSMQGFADLMAGLGGALGSTLGGIVLQ